MSAYLIRITNGQAVTEFRRNAFEVVACADSPEKAIAEAMIYAPPALKGGAMAIEIKPVPIIQ